MPDFPEGQAPDVTPAESTPEGPSPAGVPDRHEVESTPGAPGPSPPPCTERNGGLAQDNGVSPGGDSTAGLPCPHCGHRHRPSVYDFNCRFRGGYDCPSCGRRYYARLRPELVWPFRVLGAWLLFIGIVVLDRYGDGAYFGGVIAITAIVTEFYRRNFGWLAVAVEAPAATTPRRMLMDAVALLSWISLLPPAAVIDSALPARPGDPIVIGWAKISLDLLMMALLANHVVVIARRVRGGSHSSVEAYRLLIVIVGCAAMLLPPAWTSVKVQIDHARMLRDLRRILPVTPPGQTASATCSAGQSAVPTSTPPAPAPAGSRPASPPAPAPASVTGSPAIAATTPATPTVAGQPPQTLDQIVGAHFNRIETRRTILRIYCVPFFLQDRESVRSPDLSVASLKKLLQSCQRDVRTAIGFWAGWLAAALTAGLFLPPLRSDPPTAEAPGAGPPVDPPDAAPSDPGQTEVNPATARQKSSALCACVR